MRSAAARTLHGLVAVMVLVGVGVEVVTAFTDGPGVAGSMAERLTRLLSYFTIQSNLLVGGTSALLALDPQRDGRVFRVLRLDGLLCIGVTGIVYHAVLAGLQELTPSGAFANLLLHTTVPVVAVVAWLVVGPRPRADRATVLWSVAYPVAWLVWTFGRGAVVDWYPYPFLDVGAIGGAQAVLNALVVAVVFLLLAGVVAFVEHRLPPTPRTVRDGSGAVEDPDASVDAPAR
ncbi:Pr6Pr family membrane protein [Cellulomonas sp. NPDC055163]